jgi:predicted ATPase/class 3 adenylate cyclase/DNA-binding CsgD family transcriptional regulator
MGDLPSGTLTFLFTDLEGSTSLWESEPDVMREAVARHDELLGDAVTAHGGQVVKTTGDGIVAVFVNATEGVATALGAQRALGGEDWTVPIKARMGLYTGEAQAADGDYHSPTLNRAARVMDAGHGGQVLLAASTAGLAAGSLPAGTELVDLGEHRLRDLGQPEVLFQLVHPDLERSFAPLRTLESYPGNLPLQISSFIGREQTLDRCRQSLDHNRVLTLTGVGGVGKTRLAIQLAGLVVPEFRDGAWLCELAPVRDHAGVAEAVAATLGAASGSSDVESSLVEALASKDVLLVLDNCEHVLGGVSELVSRIVESCPAVKVLATSREGMAILGEQIIAVPPLQIGKRDAGIDEALGSDAVELFTERARSVNADFSLDADNAEAVVEICRRLDGVPLAIELAAARVIALGPQDLARRLDRRFQMLAGGRRGAVERHATLRAAIDWSYDLLSEPEKTLLSRLSVFAGTFDLEAAEAICTGGTVDEFEVLDLLTGLVSQSLVVADQRRIGTRYKLLETIRQYGEEQLDPEEIATMRDRHARHFTDSVETGIAEIWGPDGIAINQRRAADGDNLLAAYVHAIDSGNVDVAIRLTTLADFLLVGEMRSPPVAPVIALEGSSGHRLFRTLLVSAAYQAHYRGDHDEAEGFYQRAIAIPESDEDTEIERALWVDFFPGRRHIDAGRHDEANVYFGSLNEKHLGAASPGLQATWLSCWVASSQLGGLDSDTSTGLAEESVALARQSGSPLATALASTQLANVIAHESPEQATALLISSVETFGRPGQEMPLFMSAASVVALELGQTGLAMAIGTRVLGLTRWQPEPALSGGQLACCARGAADSDPETAGVLVGAAYAAFRLGAQNATSSPDATSHQRVNPFVQALRETNKIVAGALGQDQARARRSQGLDMNLDDATTYALTHINAPPVLTALDNLKTANSAPDPSNPTQDDTHDLTDRQLEVARLVARGLTNKAIAEKLDVSPYTVETHVRNILERLDATNRTQIGAWVMANQNG